MDKSEEIKKILERKGAKKIIIKTIIGPKEPRYLITFLIKGREKPINIYIDNSQNIEDIENDLDILYNKLKIEKAIELAKE